MFMASIQSRFIQIQGMPINLKGDATILHWIQGRNSSVLLALVAVVMAILGGHCQVLQLDLSVPVRY
jgi:hypothetical protein